MKKHAVAAASVLLGLALMGDRLQAQTMTCNRDFAQIGNSKFTIQQKCGEPVFKDAFCKKVDEQAITSTMPGGTRPIVILPNACDQVEEWTYKPGSGQFVTMLLFQNGSLKSMRYGDRIP